MIEFKIYKKNYSIINNTFRIFRLFYIPLLFLFVQPSQAHHSPAAFDTNQEITVSGTIIKYRFGNPHIYMSLAIKNEAGIEVEMEVEAGAGSVISPLGFTKEAVAVGDIVTVVGNPGIRRPGSLMLGKELYKLDGSYYPLHIQSRSNYEVTSASATSIAGTWFASRASFYEYLGNSREWDLTAKGIEAMANIDPLETPQKDCIPLTSPTLLLYPVANTIEVYDDRVIINIDWMDSKRIIYLDDQESPETNEEILHGFSTGHWEDDTLIIESSHYTDHLMGLSFFLPGSKEKQLIEHIRLNDDGKSISYSGTVIDPEYINGSAQWSGEWFYRPDMEHSNEICDLEVAHKFLDD